MITPNHEHGSFSDTFKYYEEIHKRYRTLPDSTLFISDFKDPWGKFLKSIENPQTPKTPEQLYDEMKVKCFGVGYPNLSASSSETTLYFTAEQVAKFYGVEKLPSSLRISKKHRGRPDKAPKK